jgi:serine/threonine protein kinase
LLDAVKISDFGFAKMIVDQEMKNNPIYGTSVGNKSDYNSGTPIYMSPQVLLG